MNITEVDIVRQYINNCLKNDDNYKNGNDYNDNDINNN